MRMNLIDCFLMGALAALGVLYVPVVSSTASSVPQATQPSNEELEILNELAAWIQGSPGETDRLNIESASFELFTWGPEENSVSERVSDLPFGQHIHRAAERAGLDPILLAAVVEVESSFNPAVVSSRGALGLMQLMPATASDLRVEDPLDPASNLSGGARYLVRLLEKYDGDMELALAAYNAGPGNVRRFGGVPPFRETRRYVEKVINVYVAHYRDLWTEKEEISLGSPWQSIS